MRNQLPILLLRKQGAPLIQLCLMPNLQLQKVAALFNAHRELQSKFAAVFNTKQTAAKLCVGLRQNLPTHFGCPHWISGSVLD